jgi:hypothetical protein|tara:strand:+ start:6162 stop:6329 length:168 start_codon:yes stop_codon:yes gene_type:complete
VERDLTIDIGMMKPEERVKGRDAGGHQMSWRKLDVNIVVNVFQVPSPPDRTTALA